MPTLAVLTAAGSGTRLGYDVPKALVELGGLPLVVHAARNLCASGVVDQIVVTCPPGLVDHVEVLLRGDPAVDRPVRAVVGGPTRQVSVEAGLRAGLGAADASAGVDVVVVHDAARPLAPPSLVERVVRAVQSGRPAVVPGVPVTDTVKRVAPVAAPDGVESVVDTIDRSALRAIQTPQGFDRSLLVRAHEAAKARSRDEAVAATDDAGLVEWLGEPVYLVPGDPVALKVTTPRDLRVAMTFLRDGSP